MKKTGNTRDYQRNKVKQKGNQSNKNKRFVTMIKKRRINSRTENDDVPIIAENNDVLRRLEKLEQQWNKSVHANN